MSKESQSLIVNYVDENGRLAKSKFQFALEDTPEMIEDAWLEGQALVSYITGAGITSAEVTSAVDTTPTEATSHPGTNTAMDKIRWSFLDEDSNPVQFTTPAPLADDVGEDDYHVDDTNGDILNFIEWCKDFLVSPYGKVLLTFVDGVRVWRNRKSKNA